MPTPIRFCDPGFEPYLGWTNEPEIEPDDFLPGDLELRHMSAASDLIPRRPVMIDVTEPALRCQECGNFRHATPKHKPSCSKAERNCPGCTGVSEGHIPCCPLSIELERAQ